MNPHDQNADNAFGSPQHGEQEKKSRGCFFYGCLGSVLLLLLLVVGGGLAGYFGLKNFVQAYTSEEPVELPVVEATEEELAEIQGRMDKLKESFDEGVAPPPLELTADDLNALIAQDEELKGRVYLTIEDGKITGDVSIPTDFVPTGKGRFLNAKGTFDVSFQNGVLIVTLADAEVKGEPLPEPVMTALANENLAQDLYSDPKNAKFLRQFESIEIKDDRIILKPNEGAADGDEENSESSDKATLDADNEEDSEPPADAVVPATPSPAG